MPISRRKFIEGGLLAGVYASLTSGPFGLLSAATKNRLSASQEFRLHYDKHALAILDLAYGKDTDAIRNPQLDQTENFLSNIAYNDLTPVDQHLHDHLSDDVTRLRNGIPFPEVVIDYKKKTATLDNITNLIRINNKAMTGKDIYALTDFMIKEGRSYLEFADMEEGRWYPLEEGSLDDLEDRFVAVKGTDKSMKHFYDQDTIFKNLAKSIDYFVFVPSLFYKCQGAEGKVGCRAGAGYIGNNIVAVNTDQDSESRNYIPYMSHEIQHKRAAHWLLPKLNNEKLATKVELACINRLKKSDVSYENLTSKRSGVIGVAEYLNLARFGDTFAGVIPFRQMSAIMFLLSLEHKQIAYAHDQFKDDSLLEPALLSAAIASNPALDKTKKIKKLKALPEKYQTHNGTKSALYWLE